MSVLKVRGIRHDAAASDAINLDSSGNVGIGTASPSNKLQVESAGTNYISSRNSVSGGIAGLICQNGSDTRGIRINDASLELYDFSAGVSRLSIDGSGRVTMPYQPAFFAFRTVSDANSGTATDQKITYDSTNHNVGSHYNTSNGRFTAPIAGKYLICVNTTFVSSSVSARYMRTQLWKNGSTPYLLAGHNHASNESGDGDYHQITMCGVVSLAANDYIEVYWATAASASQIQLAGFDTNVSFSGQLIS